METDLDSYGELDPSKNFVLDISGNVNVKGSIKVGTNTVYITPDGIIGYVTDDKLNTTTSTLVRNTDEKIRDQSSNFANNLTNTENKLIDLENFNLEFTYPTLFQGKELKLPFLREGWLHREGINLIEQTLGVDIPPWAEKASKIAFDVGIMVATKRDKTGISSMVLRGTLFGSGEPSIEEKLQPGGVVFENIYGEIVRRLSPTFDSITDAITQLSLDVLACINGIFVPPVMVFDTSNSPLIFVLPLTSRL